MLGGSIASDLFGQLGVPVMRLEMAERKPLSPSDQELAGLQNLSVVDKNGRVKNDAVLV